MNQGLKILLAVPVITTFLYAPPALADGAKLFAQKRCKSCHIVEDPGARRKCPDLTGVMGRHSKAWVTMWLTNPQKMWEGDHPETLQLKKWKPRRDKAKKTNMKIGKLSPEQIEELIAYLDTTFGK